MFQLGGLTVPQFPSSPALMQQLPNILQNFDMSNIVYLTVLDKLTSLPLRIFVDMRWPMREVLQVIKQQTGLTPRDVLLPNGLPVSMESTIAQTGNVLFANLWFA